MGDLPQKIAHKLESLENTLLDNQIVSTDQAVSGIDSRLRDEIKKSSNWISTTFTNELQSQLCQLSAHLKEIFHAGKNDTEKAAETAGACAIPWKSEKRLILRKLELLATGSHAYLEFLRHEVDALLKQPVAEFTPFFDSQCGRINSDTSRFMGKLESQEKGFVVSLTNFENVYTSRKLIGHFTRWYRRDKYLQLATDLQWADSSLTLKVFIKWGEILQGSSDTSHVEQVYIKHPDYPRNQHVPMTKSSTRDESEPVLCGFQDEFQATLPFPRTSGFAKHGRLTFVVCLKNNSSVF